MPTKAELEATLRELVTDERAGVYSEYFDGGGSALTCIYCAGTEDYRQPETVVVHGDDCPVKVARELLDIQVEGVK